MRNLVVVLMTMLVTVCICWAVYRQRPHVSFEDAKLIASVVDLGNQIKRKHMLDEMRLPPALYERYSSADTNWCNLNRFGIVRVAGMQGVTSPVYYEPWQRHPGFVYDDAGLVYELLGPDRFKLSAYRDKNMIYSHVFECRRPAIP